MFNRQRIYVTLAVSAGVVTGVSLFFYFQHRRKIASLKATTDINRRLSHSITTDDQSSSRRGTHEDGLSTMDFLNGSNTLTSAQAVILTGYLTDYQADNDEKLQNTLTTIANLGTFAENQNHLTNAGCIERLRELLSSTDNQTTQKKILLALNNLALNNNSIVHYTNFVQEMIQFCERAPAKSLLRLYALNLLMNMCVLEDLHEEYRKNIAELGTLLGTVWTSNDEALSAGKMLVNLSANKANLESLLKLTNVELKIIVNQCAAAKRSRDEDQITEVEEVLLRYLTFHCNIAENVVHGLRNEFGRAKSIFLDPKPHPQGALYFELFDQDKQMALKSILRPQYTSPVINQYVRRLLDAVDTIRQIQFESSVSNVNDEFGRSESILESSTPKRPMISSMSGAEDDSFGDLEKQVNGDFDDDDDQTILADGASSPSDQSRASFLSALSTNDNNPPFSPEKSTPIDEQ